MAEDFAAAFQALCGVMAGCAESLVVKTDAAAEYTLETKSPSPFPQHKGRPMFFGSVKAGKAYVSLHLMPLYMCPALAAKIPAGLSKKMQGKTCFQFKKAPEPETLRELQDLARACLKDWDARGWL